MTKVLMVALLLTIVLVPAVQADSLSSAATYNGGTSMWDYTYTLTLSSISDTGYNFEVQTPYQPSSTSMNSVASTYGFSWTWDTNLQINNIPVMIASSTTPLFPGEYDFYYSSSYAPVPRPYVAYGTPLGSGTALSNPEPGTIGMAFLVLGMVGLLRKRRTK